LILGKKDGVLPYEDNVTQIENTRVQLTTFPDGHMSHLENQKALEKTVLAFLKTV
jgi:pimeloyl-ACP methyl ester carboxylesterase